MAKINFEPLWLPNVSFKHKKCNPYPWKPYSRHKNRDSMYHGSKVIAKNRFWLLPMSAILDFEVTKMPSWCNHYTHWILNYMVQRLQKCKERIVTKHCKVQPSCLWNTRPVLAFGYYRCLRLSVRLCVRLSRACPRDNSSPVQARITKFGP